MSTIFRNALVVGATGRLGSAFVAALVESPLKFNVHVLARDSAVRMSLHCFHIAFFFGRFMLATLK